MAVASAVQQQDEMPHSPSQSLEVETLIRFTLYEKYTYKGKLVVNVTFAKPSEKCGLTKKTTIQLLQELNQDIPQDENVDMMEFIANLPMGEFSETKPTHVWRIESVYIGDEGLQDVETHCDIGREMLNVMEGVFNNRLRGKLISNAAILDQELFCSLLIFS